MVVDDDGGQVGVAGEEFGKEATDRAGPVEVERPVGVARLRRRLLPGSTGTSTSTSTAGCCFAASVGIASGSAIGTRVGETGAVTLFAAHRVNARTDPVVAGTGSRRIRCCASGLLFAAVV